MDVKLHVDLETLQLIEGPGFRNPVTSLRFKRGDAARLEVSFLDGGITPRLPSAIRPRWKSASASSRATATTSAISFMMPFGRCRPWMPRTPSISVRPASTPWNSIRHSAWDRPPAPSFPKSRSWARSPGARAAGEPTSTRTFLVVVENDVNRGTEGVPTSAEPPYPLPQNIASPADVAAAMTAHLNATDPHPKYLRHDAQESLTATQRGYVRNAIQAAEAPPDLTLPRQNINGVWYPAGLRWRTHQLPARSDDRRHARMEGAHRSLRNRRLDQHQERHDHRQRWLGEDRHDLHRSFRPAAGQFRERSTATRASISFGLVEAGRNYHVRIDNFSDIPVSGEYFGISNVNYGSASFSNVQTCFEQLSGRLHRKRCQHFRPCSTARQRGLGYLPSSPSPPTAPSIGPATAFLRWLFTPVTTSRNTSPSPKSNHHLRHDRITIATGRAPHRDDRQTPSA